MKFAIFGDIHANLEGLVAVLEDAENNNCTHHICTGDIVGYNANPEECIELIRKLNCPVVKGNHDEEASNESDLLGLNPLAEQALLWTRDNISKENRDWLQDLRMIRQVSDFTIVHATLDTPSGWTYVTTKFDAMANFSYQYTTLCFYGHTHIPWVYIYDSTIKEIKGAFSLRTEPNSKYFVNVGSVGQPRDGNWRAAYAIYDSEKGTLRLRRVNYDVETAKKKILEAGLPEMLANRLSVGR